MARRRRPSRLAQRARQLRKNATFPERLLWSHLRNRQLLGQKFRRQHILSPYIVDFYCLSAQLIIELDGEIHDRPKVLHYDRHRERFLSARYGTRILRFTNTQVLQNTDAVLAEIAQSLLQFPP